MNIQIVILFCTLNILLASCSILGARHNILSLIYTKQVPTLHYNSSSDTTFIISLFYSTTPVLMLPSWSLFKLWAFALFFFILGFPYSLKKRFIEYGNIIKYKIYSYLTVNLHGDWSCHHGYQFWAESKAPLLELQKEIAKVSTPLKKNLSILDGEWRVREPSKMSKSSEKTVQSKQSNLWLKTWQLPQKKKLAQHSFRFYFCTWTFIDLLFPGNADLSLFSA